MVTLEGLLSTQRDALTDAEETTAQLRADLALAQAQARQYESAAGAQAQQAREAERTAARRARELEVAEAQRRGLETKTLSLEVRSWSWHRSWVTYTCGGVSQLPKRWGARCDGHYESHDFFRTHLKTFQTVFLAAMRQRAAGAAHLRAGGRPA